MPFDSEDDDEKEVDEAAKPDYIDADGDGDETESMKKAFKDKKKKNMDEQSRPFGQDKPSSMPEPFGQDKYDFDKHNVDFGDEFLYVIDGDITNVVVDKSNILSFAKEQSARLLTADELDTYLKTKFGQDKTNKQDTAFIQTDSGNVELRTIDIFNPSKSNDIVPTRFIGILTKERPFGKDINESLLITRGGEQQLRQRPLLERITKNFYGNK